jgi:hypothetical protein
MPHESKSSKGEGFFNTNTMPHNQPQPLAHDVAFQHKQQLMADLGAMNLKITLLYHLLQKYTKSST